MPYSRVVSVLVAGLPPEHESSANDKAGKQRHELSVTYSERLTRGPDYSATADKSNDYENQHCAVWPSLLARCGQRIGLPLFEHRTLPRYALLHQIAQIIRSRIDQRQNLLVL